MKQTTEQLKAVRDNAPEGATHYAENFKFLAFNGNEKWMRYDPNGLNGFCWFKADDVNLKSIKYMHSLADIAEIIELREKIEAMHKAWNKNQAKDQDLLHECSNENEKLREKLAQAQSELTKFIQNTEKELRKGAEAL